MNKFVALDNALNDVLAFHQTTKTPYNHDLVIRFFSYVELQENKFDVDQYKKNYENWYLNLPLGVENIEIIAFITVRSLISVFNLDSFISDLDEIFNPNDAEFIKDMLANCKTKEDLYSFFYRCEGFKISNIGRQNPEPLKCLLDVNSPMYKFLFPLATFEVRSVNAKIRFLRLKALAKLLDVKVLNRTDRLALTIATLLTPYDLSDMEEMWDYNYKEIKILSKDSTAVSLNIAVELLLNEENHLSKYYRRVIRCLELF